MTQRTRAQASHAEGLTQHKDTLIPWEPLGSITKTTHQELPLSTIIMQKRGGEAKRELWKILEKNNNNNPVWQGLRYSVGEKSKIKLDRQVCQMAADSDTHMEEFAFYSVDSWGAECR